MTTNLSKNPFSNFTKIKFLRKSARSHVNVKDKSTQSWGLLPANFFQEIT